MKNTRALVVLALALAAGLVAMVLAARWLNQRATPGTQIVVAMRDVALGTPLDATSVQTVSWPASMVPQGAFTDAKQLQGRVVLTTLARGEPILEAKLAPEGTRGGLSAVIASGRRAITVKVNEVMGVAGFALPGNHVDVMVNTTLDEGNNRRGGTVSKIVLERILVLAVAQEASRDETKPKVVNAVTLEVTPEQAEKLDLARSVGTLSLVLRNQIDREPTLTAGITKPELFQAAAASAPEKVPPRATRKVTRRTAAPAPAAAPRPAAPREQVEVIRGVVRNTVDL